MRTALESATLGGMIRRLLPEDLDELNRWYAAHGAGPVPGRTVPEFGLIVPDVAAGHLYRTDSDIALIDGLVTNPEASSATRHEALTGIVGGLLAEARRTGCARVLAFTKHDTIRRRAMDLHGARDLGAFSLFGVEF